VRVKQASIYLEKKGKNGLNWGKKKKKIIPVKTPTAVRNDRQKEAKSLWGRRMGKTRSCGKTKTLCIHMQAKPKKKKGRMV